MSKHTPGPWDNDCYHIVDSDGNAICVVEPDVFSKKREEANTKLIKAAPDMLEAAERFNILSNSPGIQRFRCRW